MNKKDEALKMAIDTLISCGLKIDPNQLISSKFYTNLHETIHFCKKALEQPSKNIRDSFNKMLEDKVAYYKNKQPAQKPVGVNHEEAYELALMKQNESNLARCYLNLRLEQEPVDVARVQEDGYVEWNPDLPDLPVGTKLYTHPAPSWQGLSDDEISEFIINKITDFDFARAIEQSLKEKNCSL